MKARLRSFPLPALITLLTALGLLIRLPFFTARSLWFDEAFSWRLVSYLPTPEFFERAATDVHPVLYYLALWLWMVPVRVSSPEVTLLWMRLLSVLFGGLTVTAMMLAARSLFRSRWITAATGLLTAVNAFQVQYAWEARMYTLGTVLLPLAMLGLARASTARARRAAWRGGLGFGLSLGALLHVHYYALFSWLALGFSKLFLFLGQMLRRGFRPVIRSVNFRAAEVGFLLSALLFLPWVPVFLEQAERVQAAFWIPRLQIWSVPNTMARLFWGGVGDIPHLWAVFGSLLAVILVAVALLRGRSIGDLIAAMSFVVPVTVSILVSQRTSVYLDRYFLFASVGLLLLLARVLSFLPRAVRTWTLLFAAFVGVFSVTQFWSQLQFPLRPGARGAAADILARAETGDHVVASSPFVYFPMSFHLGCGESGVGCRNDLVVKLYSETGEFSHFAGAPILRRSELVGQDIFRFLTPTAKPARLWVVDTTGFGGSSLALPATFTLAQETAFRELFPFQGDIIVREYRR